MPPSSLIRNLIAGELKQNFIITPAGEAHTNILGGSLTHAAVGLKIWEQDNSGLISRVGEDFPRQWIKTCMISTLTPRASASCPMPSTCVNFINYTKSAAAKSDNPVASYAELGLPFPKVLLGYTPPSQEIDSRTRPSDDTIRIKDVPDHYLDASAAHLCPLDFHSHQFLISLFMQNKINTITLDPGDGYMHPIFWDDLSLLLNGITAFQVSEEKLHAIFRGRTTDLWEMAEELAHLAVKSSSSNEKPAVR